MSSAILTVLDYIGKNISRLRKAIIKGDLRLVKARYENLVDFSDYIQSLLPKEFVETAFRGFNSHLSYLGHFIDQKFFDYIESNFNDLADTDFPELKTEIYRFLEKSKLPEQKITSNNVFIVHGRKHEPVKELKAMLKSFGLDPVILHEKPSGSRTIVEKLEKYSDVGYAFVILTPDDVLAPCKQETVLTLEDDKLKEEAESLVPLMDKAIQRARQNVVLEFGYFIGKLGRDRVCCLHKGDVELPSDMHGIVYIPFEGSVNEVKDKIIEELEAAGYKIKR